MKIQIQSSDIKFSCDLIDWLNDYPIEDPDSTRITLMMEDTNDNNAPSVPTSKDHEHS